MRKRIIKLITFSVFSLAIAGIIAPVEAAPKAQKDAPVSDNYELKEFDGLPNSAKTLVIISSFFISGAGVLVGTGNSIKYENELAKNSENDRVNN